jgi:hypothetical protein
MPDRMCIVCVLEIASAIAMAVGMELGGFWFGLQVKRAGRYIAVLARLQRI